MQSIGGANVSVHVMVNNGDETFTLDVDRVSERVHYNRPEEHWYFAGVHLADIDNDGEPSTYSRGNRATTTRRPGTKRSGPRFARPPRRHEMGVRVSRQAPLVYRNNASGQFRPTSPEPFLRARMYTDEVMPADVDGDRVTDIVNLEYNEGRDRLVGTRDDYGVFVTLLNATRPRPIRCRA